MPVVENVFSHWIDLFSVDRDVVEYDDHIFYFGFDATRDILVTTSLSALTLGVDIDRRQVGTIGTRVQSYFFFDNKGKLQYKELPPSYEWNSEYISRCISVRVRTAVFFATGTSLSNVYVFHRPGTVEKAVGKLGIKAVTSIDRKTKKSIHRTTVSGPASLLKADWKAIEKSIWTETAALCDISVSRIELTVKNGRFRRQGRAEAQNALGAPVPLLK